MLPIVLSLSPQTHSSSSCYFPGQATLRPQAIHSTTPGIFPHHMPHISLWVPTAPRIKKLHFWTLPRRDCTVWAVTSSTHLPYTHPFFVFSHHLFFCNTFQGFDFTFCVCDYLINNSPPLDCKFLEGGGHVWFLLTILGSESWWGMLHIVGPHSYVLHEWMDGGTDTQA